MLTNRMGRLTYVNPAWCATYGYTHDEAIGQTPRLLRSRHQSDEFYKSMWQTILDPAIGFWRGEVVNCAKDGHHVPVLLTITPYREPGGTITGYMGIAVDLTEQKRMEQQILRQDRLASIGMLAGGLAHEIGNPLGVIRGRAELIAAQMKDNPNAAGSLDVIVGQIDRISRLIQSLLHVSRMPDQILLREVSLNHAVDSVFLLMSEACRAHSIRLKKTNLDLSVLAEPSHLEQLLLNLIINSMHAIEEKIAKGQKSTEENVIELRGERVPGEPHCILSIRDTGCGISAENVEKIFQPFFTTKSAGKGTGLGLAIVSRLVDEMQGQISVVSPGVGLGATFKIKFKTVSH